MIARWARAEHVPAGQGMRQAGRQLGVLVLVLLGVVACKPAAKPAAAPPAAHVRTVAVHPHDVTLTYLYLGRVTAFRKVEVRARVGGLLLKRNFVEGQRVRAGDVLFQIDPAPYQAAVARAAAQVEEQTALKEKAERDLRRAKALVESPAGSAKAYDDALSAMSLASAQLAAAQADLRIQALNLSWTTVTAPIGGVTSLEAVPEGSIVGETTTNSLLTRITQVDPIYVTFSFDSDDLDQIRRTAGPAAKLTARVGVDDTTMTGAVNFTDSSVDQDTGTVLGRALFANPDHRLQPGAFVQVALGGVTLGGAVTVPKVAISQDETGTFVYVADHGRARRVDVTLGADSGDDIVANGVRAGDEVVTEGLVNVREGGAIMSAQADKPRP